MPENEETSRVPALRKPAHLFKLHSGQNPQTFGHPKEYGREIWWEAEAREGERKFVLCLGPHPDPRITKPTYLIAVGFGHVSTPLFFSEKVAHTLGPKGEIEPEQFEGSLVPKEHLPTPAETAAIIEFLRRADYDLEEPNPSQPDAGELNRHRQEIIYRLQALRTKPRR